MCKIFTFLLFTYFKKVFMFLIFLAKAFKDDNGFLLFSFCECLNFVWKGSSQLILMEKIAYLVQWLFSPLQSTFHFSFCKQLYKKSSLFCQVFKICPKAGHPYVTCLYSSKWLIIYAWPLSRLKIGVRALFFCCYY